ncbi:MAG TPA: nuclear transport factor 2 family protein [Puia sp.]|nr:nuclear transport factor 2 family protein [Puia sp.]
MKRTIFLRSFVSGILMMWAALSCQSGFAQTSSDQSERLQEIPSGKIVLGWYTSFVKKDWNSMAQILADGFTFSSPLDDHIDVAHFKDRCWPNAYNLKRFEVNQFVVDGDKVFVISTGWTNDGKPLRNGDFFILKDGKIRAYECFFGPGINYPNSGK